jgi:transcriptional regulator with AbiEi antitoxin domain of type IV toxin-antitoxin system
MTDRRLLIDIKSRLRGILDEVPFIRAKRWTAQRRLAQRRVASQVDLVVDLVADRKAWRLLVEVKGSGEPRIVRAGIQQIRQLQSVGKKRTYGLIAASYIGPESRKLCRDANIGFIDLAGNCRLAFNQIFIEHLGSPNPLVERRPLRSIFTPKASRILRVLLEAPKKPWKVQDLAREAKVSLGLTAKVKQRLLDLEFAREEKNGLLLLRAEELVRRWGAAYSFPKGDSMDCYGQGDVSKLERQLSDYCRQANIRHGFALFSGAARVAPFARYARGFAYVHGDLATVAKDLGWKPVSSGANFSLLAPFDEGLWNGSRELNGESIVSDVQLYLDLVGYKGRGEEAADAILEQRLRPQW